MPTLTVFTPTYNRAHTLGRTYESLCRQTSRDFEWLVIDDGSTDGTRQLVEGWKAEGRIPIRYIYQRNQGMHSAHNTAYANIETELNTCIDSDDWMPDDAVETIVKFWEEKGSPKHAGIIGLDVKTDGSVIGTRFDKNLKSTTLTGYYRNGGKGDKKLVYRTDVINSYPPYPIFEGERYVGLIYKYALVDEDYTMLTINKPLVIVDYQTDGSSMNMLRQYWNNPKGWIFLRKEQMRQAVNIKERLHAHIHYVAHSLRLGNKRLISESPNKLLTTASFLPGLVLYLYTRHKVGKQKK